MTPHALPLSRLLDHTADAVLAVRSGQSLTDVLARVPADARAGTQALSFHVLRWLGGATRVREAVAPKAPPPKVDALLTTALALLWPTDAPPYNDHTLVDQAVAAAHHRTPAAAGFINAVLRRFIRERAALVSAAAHDPVGAFNHPLWWIERVRQDWPSQWQAILQAANRHPPMTLRVNARRGTAQAYAQRLAAQGRAATVLGPHALALAQPCPVQQLPGFAEGEVSVQDAAAQRAAPLLLGGEGAAALPAGARVLDACAAPGGKTAHLLELADLDVLALDSDPVRLARVRDTLNRLQLRAEMVAADARDTRAWWDGRPFDAILLDAPCSASGIVRRHPDIRWLRRADDVDALSRIQAQMLDALWPLLAPGGRLVYATCSVFRAEGSLQIDAFLQRQGTSSVRLDPASPGHLLPVPDNPTEADSLDGSAPAVADGFYYALLHKP
ncbi:16S rRNA (cytosine(967)-C(5))-methyltransferase RsmB [Aquincola sp. MAHUQ-54]|uniref:16S rRNA (Cytosine(967)-C(5))-methyltransferase RsmB n=1 Tax=Aquincola agrisoli TaxID=3119538 RepID=A0AAW9QE10_9BURK